jgi:uncharacterized membrane protein YccC
VLAVSFAIYRTIPHFGLAIGFMVGVPLFFLVAIGRREHIRIVVRSCAFAGAGAFLGMTFGTQTRDGDIYDIPSILIGAMVGWFIGTIRTQWLRRQAKRSNPTIEHSMNMDANDGAC